MESLASMSIAQISDKDWLDFSDVESNIMCICICKCKELQDDSSFSFTTELEKRKIHTLGL